MRTFLLYVENLKEAIAEIKNHKGNVTQICTQHVIVCNLPEDFDFTALELSSISFPKIIDTTSKLFFDAWHLNLQKEDVPIHKWDAEGFMPPGKMYRKGKLLGPPETLPYQRSSYMAGYIAVGLIIVSGEQSQLIFSSDETGITVNQVMKGLQALASFEPLAQITFIYQISLLSIDAEPQTSCPEMDSCEANWRDPALKLLGYNSGYEGVDDYNKELIDTLKTDWAFTAFFTKYPQGHFAYAGTGRLCMEYSNGGLGSHQISTVFAHEVSHLFGAADEYSDSGCNCETDSFFNIPNFNCENCSSDFPKGGCLMAHNDISNICPWTRGQLGWPFHIPMHGASRTSPSITVFNDKLYVAFVANNNSYELLLGSSSDGINWTYSNMDATSKAAPSLAVFNDKLHVAFVANNGTNTLLSGSSVDGVNWSYNSMEGSSKTSPSLTVFNNKLYVAFIANNETNSLLSGSSNDGKSWTYVNMEGASRTAPSLTVFNNKLHVAFVANNESYELLMGTSSDGKKWTYTSMGGSSKASPSITVLNGKMYVVLVANEVINHLVIGFSDDGKNWSYSPMNKTSQGPPSIVGMTRTTHNPEKAHRLYVVFVEDNVVNGLLIWRAQNVIFE